MELVDMLDLESSAVVAWGFKSLQGHHFDIINNKNCGYGVGVTCEISNLLSSVRSRLSAHREHEMYK